MRPASLLDCGLLTNKLITHSDGKTEESFYLLHEDGTGLCLWAVASKPMTKLSLQLKSEENPITTIDLNF